MRFTNVIEVLDFAMKQEEIARDLHLKLSEMTHDSEIAHALQKFSTQEAIHHQNLMELKLSHPEFKPRAKLERFNNIAYGFRIRGEVPQSKEFESLDKAFLMVKQEEITSYQLYHRLCEEAKSAAVRKTLRNMAREEYRHWEFFEELTK